MSAVYRQMSISKKNLLADFGARINSTYIFKPCHSKFMVFRQKNAIWGEYSYVKHTLFILYLEGNHALFGKNYTLFGNFAVTTLIALHRSLIKVCLLC